jgi:subtilisin family serine protease
MKHSTFVGAALCALILASNPLAGAAAPTDSRSPAGVTGAARPFAPDRLLVRFKDQTAPAQRSKLHAALGARVIARSTTAGGLHVVQVASAARLGPALDAYRRDPDVLYAEPDYRIQFDETLPNDERFSDLWAMRNTGGEGKKPGADLNMARAWDITTGRDDVYIGVVDSGIDYNHVDLAANIWTNPLEIPANGIDDDGNGYVDDVHGINGATGGGDPIDPFGHGTHVSGTIAAQGNNAIGVAGVNWRARLIGCSLLDAETLDAFVSGAIRCLDYLHALKTQRGIDIIATNNSWGWIGGPSQAMREAIARQNDAGILFVASAGNNRVDTAKVPHYPSNYDLPNVISVAATDSTDHMAFFSNYGRYSVHIAAPGWDILSTYPDDDYMTAGGTSMASPHIVGVLGLLKAQDMSRTWVQLKNLLLAGGARVESMGFTISGRRVLAAGDNGSGALTCANQDVVRRLTPRRDTLVVSPDDGKSTFDFTLLSIACAQAGRAPKAVVLETGQTLSTYDDGAHGDGKAGDGIFGGRLRIGPDQTEPLTVEFSDGSRVVLSFQSNYEAPVVGSGQWRDLSSGADEVYLGDDGVHVLTLPFPLRLAGSADEYKYLAISDNGVAVPAVDEDVAYGVWPSFFNLPLPTEWFDAVLAPYWDDLVPGDTGRIFTAVRGNTPHRELVIEWRAYNTWASQFDEGDSEPNTLTFQLVVFEDRPNVLFNYADVSIGDSEYDNGHSATVGVQSAPGTERQFSVDEAKLGDGMALEWRMPENSGGGTKSWLREKLGAFDAVWMVVFGLAGWWLRQRRNGRCGAGA